MDEEDFNSFALNGIPIPQDEENYIIMFFTFIS